MSTTIITGAEVFNDADPNRPVVTVLRTGGGKYVSVNASGKTEYDGYSEAIVAAETLADGKTADDVASAAYKDEQLADLRTKVEVQAAEIARLSALVPKV